MGNKGYAKLYAPDPGETPRLREAACWAHLCRDFHDEWSKTKSTIAREALDHIGALYDIEREITGQPADIRLSARQKHSAPEVDAFFAWSESQLALIPGKGDLAKAFRYDLSRRAAFSLFLEDGRVPLITIRLNGHSDRLSVPVHSAHVGQVYRVHYRWHTYFNADVKVFRTLNRGDGQHVSLERDPGIAILALAWILDASVCQGFDLGEPVVATEALCELHSVLQHLGFRRGFKGDDSPTEAPNDASQIPDTNPVATAFGTDAIADGTRIPVDRDITGTSAPDSGKSRSGRAKRRMIWPLPFRPNCSSVRLSFMYASRRRARS